MSLLPRMFMQWSHRTLTSARIARISCHREANWISDEWIDALATIDFELTPSGGKTFSLALNLTFCFSSYRSLHSEGEKNVLGTGYLQCDDTEKEDDENSKLDVNVFHLKGLMMFIPAQLHRYRFADRKSNEHRLQFISLQFSNRCRFHSRSCRVRLSRF